MSEPATAAVPVSSARRGPRYEGVGRRLLAALIDNGIWLVAALWAASAIFSAGIDDGDVLAVYSLILFTGWFNYFAFMEWRWGQTLGKMAVGLRVTKEDGERRAGTTPRYATCCAWSTCC